MVEAQAFWPVECEEGEPELYVCMSCLNEVYRLKIPMPACPSCEGVSTYESFTLESILDWGSEELVAKAQEASREHAPQPAPSESTPAEIDSPPDQSFV